MFGLFEMSAQIKTTIHLEIPSHTASFTSMNTLRAGVVAANAYHNALNGMQTTYAYIL